MDIKWIKILLILCCWGCSSVLCGFEKLDDHLDYALDKAIEVGKEMAQEHGLHLASLDYSHRSYLERVGIEFSSEQELSVDEVRRLYMRLVAQFLREINGDRQLRPYLFSYPMTEHGAVKIYFLNSDPDSKQHYVDKNFVARVSSFHGVIYYKAFDPEVNDYVLLHEEPFEEAVRIVHEEETK